jgi:GTP-binding protein
MLWRELNSEETVRVVASKESLIHRPLDIQSLEFDPEDEIAEDIDDDYDEEENYYEEDF